jgi:hypothetical protein
MTINANIEIINVGIVPNDGSGDPLRTSMMKINNNFSNLYSNGQVTGNVTDSRINPSFSWPNARRSGLYHVGIGTVGISVDGQDGLVLKNDGTLTFNNLSLIGGGLGLSSRRSASGNTVTLASSTTGYIDIQTFANAFVIGVIATNSESRIRMYISELSRTNDLARNAGTPYSANAGILCDFSTPGAQSESFTPAIVGYDAAGQRKVYVTVTNLAGTSKSTQVSLAYIPIEL